MIIDGENCILGRLATVAAKTALKGEEVSIVNAEKVVVSGNPKSVIGAYRERRTIKDCAKPEKSPKFPRRPDFFVRRAIRGMLPYHSRRGTTAYHRIKAYIGVPDEFRGKHAKVAEAGEMKTKTTTVGEVCKNLGWKG